MRFTTSNGSSEFEVRMVRPSVTSTLLIIHVLVLIFTMTTFADAARFSTSANNARRRLPPNTRIDLLDESSLFDFSTHIFDGVVTEIEEKLYIRHDNTEKADKHIRLTVAVDSVTRTTKNSASRSTVYDAATSTLSKSSRRTENVGIDEGVQVGKFVHVITFEPHQLPSAHTTSVNNNGDFEMLRGSSFVPRVGDSCTFYSTFLGQKRMQYTETFPFIAAHDDEVATTSSALHYAPMKGSLNTYSSLTPNGISLIARAAKTNGGDATTSNQSPVVPPEEVNRESRGQILSDHFQEEGGVRESPVWAEPVGNVAQQDSIRHQENNNSEHFSPVIITRSEGNEVEEEKNENEKDL